MVSLHLVIVKAFACINVTLVKLSPTAGYTKGLIGVPDVAIPANIGALIIIDQHMKDSAALPVDARIGVGEKIDSPARLGAEGETEDVLIMTDEANPFELIRHISRLSSDP